MDAKIQISKDHGLFDLKPIYDWLRQALDGNYLFSIRKVRKIRTGDQNGWLWGCIYPMMLDGLLEAGWEFVSVEQVHDYFRDMFAMTSVVNKHTGEVIDFPGSTADMDTVSFSSYCEQLRDYAREYLNIEIPDPDKYRKHESNNNQINKIF